MYHLGKTWIKISRWQGKPNDTNTMDSIKVFKQYAIAITVRIMGGYHLVVQTVFG